MMNKFLVLTIACMALIMTGCDYQRVKGGTTPDVVPVSTNGLDDIYAICFKGKAYLVYNGVREGGITATGETCEEKP